MGGVRFRSALTAALVAALSTGVASAAGASCSDAHLVPTRANSARIEAATLCLVNDQRARHGERALRPNADLGRAAAAHSADMVSRNYFDHTGPGGETLLDRIKASTYLPSRVGYILGENIALGTMQLATPAAIVDSWMKSPGHRANILNADFRDSGLGVVAQAPQRYAQGQPGATYTQQFGAISRR